MAIRHESIMQSKETDEAPFFREVAAYLEGVVDVVMRLSLCPADAPVQLADGESVTATRGGARLLDLEAALPCAPSNDVEVPSRGGSREIDLEEQRRSIPCPEGETDRVSGFRFRNGELGYEGTGTDEGW
jgi:hypothetical protein